MTQNIKLPDSLDTKYLAALIYGEASVSANEVSEEMKAIGWIVRNRYEHVDTDYGAKDKKWFGTGTSYRSIIEHENEFIAADGPRYDSFLKALPFVTNKKEIDFAQNCIKAAESVIKGEQPDIPGRDGSYPYIWFQRGKTSPNKRRAVAEPARIGVHYFWSFAEGKEEG